MCIIYQSRIARARVHSPRGDVVTVEVGASNDDLIWQFLPYYLAHDVPCSSRSRFVIGCDFYFDLTFFCARAHNSEIKRAYFLSPDIGEPIQPPPYLSRARRVY